MTQLQPRHHKVTVFGNKTTTADLIRHLIRDGHEISLVVTLSTASEAAKSIAGADDLAGVAQAMGIPVYVTQDYRLRSEQDQQFFAENTFGIGVCTGWQRLLPGHVLDAFAAGVFGFHGSCWKFPHGRGRSPLNWSVRMGGSQIYHNCFRYVEAADAGEVFNTTEFPISPGEDISSIQFKALLDMKLVTSRLLQQYAQGAIKTVQQEEGASIWLPKLGPQDGVIKFASMTCAEILNRVHAAARPFPGAFALLGAGEGSIKIWRAARFEFPLDEAMQRAAAGTVLDVSLGKVLVKCVDGCLLISEYEGSVILDNSVFL